MASSKLGELTTQALQMLDDLAKAEDEVEELNRNLRDLEEEFAENVGGTTRRELLEVSDSLNELVLDCPSLNDELQQAWGAMFRWLEVHGVGGSSSPMPGPVSTAGPPGGTGPTSPVKPGSRDPRQSLRDFRDCLVSLLGAYSGDKFDQPAQTTEDLRTHRERDRPAWEKLIHGISNDLTGSPASTDFEAVAAALSKGETALEVLLGPPKTDDSLDAKLEEKEPSDVTDMLRASIICGSPAEMTETAEKLVRFLEAREIRVVECENRFEEGEDLGGYRDINMLVEIPGSNGYVGELQIHASDIWLAKEKGGGHYFYKALNSILSDLEEAEIMAKMSDLYEAAFAQWLSK